VARGRVALEAVMSDNTLASRRTHSNEPGMSALDTIMGEVDDLSRNRG
jgi:RNA polymerase sigma-70 factor (ECF subfamily)